MAAGGGGRRRRRSRGKQCLLLVEEIRWLDGSWDSYFVFKIDVKDMFAPAAAGDDERDEQDHQAMPMRDLPRPFTRFDALPGRPERLDLAAVDSSAGRRRGTHIVAVSSDRRTVIYDAAAAAEVPCKRELRYSMTRGSTLIPLGTRLYAIATNLLPPSIYSDDSRPSFQALVPPSQPSSSSSSSKAPWSWRQLPPPPQDLYRTGSGREKTCCHLTATLAAGNRVWVSAPDRGTFSFDTARRAWRKEGDWELPWERHGLFVPDLGRLCFGVCPRRLCLCAFDAPASRAGEAPAIRYAFDETFPRECRDSGFAIFSPGSLNYLGGGRFCITWAIGIEFAGEDGALSRLAFLVMAVQVGRCRRRGELRLVKRKARCYKMLSRGVDGYALQSSLG